MRTQSDRRRPSSCHLRGRERPAAGTADQVIAAKRGMSALGQKQTCVVQEGMSAFAPKADIMNVINRVASLSRFEKVRRLGQSALCLGDKSAHYLSDLRDIFDAPRCLACRKQCCVWPARLRRRDNLVF